MKAWSEIKEEFEADGSLRDIYVEDIDSAVWEIFIGSIKSSKYKLEFTHGDASLEIPTSLAEVKRLQETDPTTLFVWLNEKIQVNCHFFIETEIELDVSPNDIISEPEYKVLIGFLEWLARTLKERVILTHEGMQNHVILSVD